MSKKLIIKEFLTLGGKIDTFNLDHQVLDLKCPSAKAWNSIYSNVGQKGRALPLPSIFVFLAPLFTGKNWLKILDYFSRYHYRPMILY